MYNVGTSAAPHSYKMANCASSFTPWLAGVFVFISFSLAVCVGVIILTMITIVISIVNHFISWLCHPMLFVGVWKLLPVCPALHLWHIRYFNCTHHLILFTDSLSDLWSLFPRQQTDQWEWMVWTWQGWDRLTWSSHSPSRRERSQVAWMSL